MADGLRIAKVEPFDLFILDLRLPDGRGTELCVKIREFDRTTPIIFYSGDTEEQLRSELKCAAQEYVMKPEIDNLLDCRQLDYYQSIQQFCERVRERCRKDAIINAHLRVLILERQGLQVFGMQAHIDKEVRKLLRSCLEVS